MSLLPGQIISPDVPIGQASEEGVVTINHDWWLLFYNLCLQILGTGAGLPADALIDIESTDNDAIGADFVALRQALANLADDYTPASSELPDIGLLLTQEPLLADPLPRAPPAQVLTVGGSPFVYTAPASGTLSVTAGTVSAVSIVRQGTSVATGLTAGLVPVCRADQVSITYSVLPTVVFLPFGM